jgi:class 3 adenylate cyclase
MATSSPCDHVGMGTGRASTAIVLFTDLVGSTEMREALGDDRADELRRRHDRLLRDAIAAHGGSEVKGTGDGLMVVFDSAAEAVSAAVAMQSSVHQAARAFAAPVAIRIGISAGDVVWEEDDCFGRPVVEARRLCDATTGGRILAADIVRMLAGTRGGHTFSAVGSLDLKGLGEPLTAAEVAWSSRLDGSPLPEVLERGNVVAFVGRVAEREELDTGWKAARAGGRRVMLLSGEPGIGKTRLAAEVARAAHDEGAVVLFGRCDEDAAVPYQPFAEALRGYAGAVGLRAVTEEADASLPALSRLVPGLFDLQSSAGPRETADAETERFLLFESVVAWLTAVASDTAVVLVLDDLHWAGKPTLLLLRHLLRADGLKGVLVLGTYRDTDLGRGHPLGEVLADLRSDPAVKRLALSGLGDFEVVEFVAAMAGHDLGDEGAALARAVYTETEGNPFFVDQVLRHLAESGSIVREQGRWGRTAHGDTLGIPQGVRDVVGRRLGRLSDASNAVLEAAAVVGREFDLDLVAGTADLDIDHVLDALEPAESARLITAVGSAGRRYMFAHALVRSTILDEIATTRRLRLHRRAALTLEPRASSDPAVLADLAHHYGEAAALGEGAKAVEYARLAAAHATHGLAYEEAADLLGRAIDVLDPSASDDQRTRADLMLGIGQALWSTGDAAGADAAFWEVVESSRQLGDAELLARAALAFFGKGVTRVAGTSDPAIVAVLEEAAAALPANDSALRAAVLARLSGELYFDIDSSERRVDLRNQAVAMAHRLSDPGTLLSVLDAGFGAVVSADGLHFRRDVCDEIVALARQVGDLEHEMNGLAFAFSSRVDAGDLDGAEEFHAQAASIAERLRQPTYLWADRVRAATVAFARGRVADAERLANEALALGRSAANATASQMFGIFEMARRRLVGGLEEMEPLTQAMVDQYPRLPAWRTGLAYIQAELEEFDAAAEQLEILAVDDFAVLPRDLNWPVGISLCAFVAARLGDRDRCALLADLMTALAGFTISAGMPADCLGASEVFTGMAALAAGRTSAGEALLAHGIERNRAIGMPGWEASGRWEWARLLLRQGDDVRARPLLTDALEGFEHIGASRLADLVRAELLSRR